MGFRAHFSDNTNVVLMPVGYGGTCNFDLILQRKELLLRKALIAYLGAASEFTGALCLGSGTIAALLTSTK